MMSQIVGMHTACPNKAQTAVKAHCRGKSPSAAPHHSTRNDWMLYSKKFTDSIHNYLLFLNTVTTNPPSNNNINIPDETIEYFSPCSKQGGLNVNSIV
jgi:hypothetical protein